MVLTTAHEGLSTRRYRTAAAYAAVEDETSPRILNGEQKFAQILGFLSQTRGSWYLLPAAMRSEPRPLQQQLPSAARRSGSTVSTTVTHQALVPQQQSKPT